MKQKQYKKNYRIQGQNKVRWTVDEVLKELQNLKKSKSAEGTDSVEIYLKINDYGNLFWHFDIYSYDEVVKK